MTQKGKLVDVERARKQLNDMLVELDRSAGTLRDEEPEENPELADYDQHPADAGTVRSDTERNEMLVQSLQQRRARAQEALQRISDGTYGYCVNCGRRLADERLEARPEVALCLRCEERSEARP